MKRLNLISGALALVAVAMTASPEAFAQENGNRDEYGNVVRGPYETNRFGDNWFIGAGGGINILWNEDYDQRAMNFNSDTEIPTPWHFKYECKDHREKRTKE